MTNATLVINAGSSSIKFAVYQFALDNNNPVLLSGKITNIGQQPKLRAVDAYGKDLSGEDNQSFSTFSAKSTHEVLIQWLLAWLNHHKHDFTIMSVGHRVVHGGRNFRGASLLSEKVLAQLKELTPLAPLHQPHNISAIEAIANWAPKLPQVACFDTSFHHTQDPIAQMFALPYEFTDKGVIRYGFHGLSYQYIASCLPEHLGELANGRIVVAHLGNGASMCALKNRKSVATTMGFTALDGLVMGQRCGSIDAGVIIHLMRQYKMSVEEIEYMLYNKSGLLGVSGESNNMQILLQSTDPKAKQAIDLFCYRAARELASLVSTLNGIDAIVFTAGIGENAAPIREQICAKLTWLGVSIDLNANQAHQTVISQSDSKVRVLVLPTNEELIIAQTTHTLLSSS